MEPSRSFLSASRSLFRPHRHPGYLALLTCPEHIVHFFRDVHGRYPITRKCQERSAEAPLISGF